MKFGALIVSVVSRTEKARERLAFISVLRVQSRENREIQQPRMLFLVQFGFQITRHHPPSVNPNQSPRLKSSLTAVPGSRPIDILTLTRLAHSNSILLHTLSAYLSPSCHGSRAQRYAPQMDFALTRLPEDPGQLLIRNVLPARIVSFEEIYGRDSVNGCVDLHGASIPH